MNQVKNNKKSAPKPNSGVVHKIDATGKVLGRLATEVSLKLRGKDLVGFQPHLESKSKVEVANASKIIMSGKKLQQKSYRHHSGYPGGLKTKKLSEVFAKNPAEVLKKAIWNMLPKNKLRSKIIRNLKITN